MCIFFNYFLKVKVNSRMNHKFFEKWTKMVQKRPFCVLFCYQRIGKLGQIFGTEYLAAFGRIFGIRSYTNNLAVQITKSVTF